MPNIGSVSLYHILNCGISKPNLNFSLVNQKKLYIFDFFLKSCITNAVFSVFFPILEGSSLTLNLIHIQDGDSHHCRQPVQNKKIQLLLPFKGNIIYKNHVKWLKLWRPNRQLLHTKHKQYPLYSTLAILFQQNSEDNILSLTSPSICSDKLSI